MTSNDDYVLQLLEEQGLVSADEIDRVKDSIKQEGETTLDVLIQTGVVEEDDVLAVIAAQFGMEFVHIEADAIDTDLTSVIPAETARKYGVVPLLKSDYMLTIALSDPVNYDNVMDALRYTLPDYDIQAVAAPKSEIKTALHVLYPQTFEEQFGMDSDIDKSVSQKQKEDDGSDDDSDAPVIRLVSMIITQAVEMHCSDIHIEPMERNVRVRYRIDGVLRQMDNPPKRLQAAIISRIKIMSGMKIAEKRIPQDGRIKVTVKGNDLDLRVSSVPTNHGESIVMRILDKSNLRLGLPQLGFLSDDQTKFEKLIALPDGVLLVTGPTGSGKTTTLYGCLNQINLPDRKIITVEDPVEYQMAGINQVQVNRDVGMDFSAALRSILRQAPNIVMIGEIRDGETADIAMEAALTGHLVFSTLHTNDAPSAVTRLLDIGVKPYLVASALRAAMAQRLVRQICPNCREEYVPTSRELKMLGALGQNKMQAISKMYKGKGCPTCHNAGYKGRKGIFEIFTVDDNIQRLIFDHSPATVLRARAREMGMRTLREDGMLKVASGMTTLEEVLRATMGDAD